MFRSLIAACVVMTSLVGCNGAVSSPTLAERAISGTPEEQEKAALEITRRGPDAIPLLRKIVAESTSSKARATAIQALGAYNDVESAPALFKAMEDDDPQVRGRAGVAVASIIGADYHFRADDPLPKRKAILGHMRQSYEKMLKHDMFKR